MPTLAAAEERWRLTIDNAPVGIALVSLEGKPELLVAASNAVQGVDPDDGSVRWWCRAAGDTASPVLGGKIVYCDSGRGGMGVAVEAGGKGDVSATKQKWKVDRVPEGFSSPIVVGEHLYRLCSPGVLKCWKLANGEELKNSLLDLLQPIMIFVQDLLSAGNVADFLRALLPRHSQQPIQIIP